jgi:DNA-binding transcriptional LysR family regulator
MISAVPVRDSRSPEAKSVNSRPICGCSIVSRIYDTRMARSMSMIIPIIGIHDYPRFLTNSIENAIEAALADMGLVQLLSYQVSGLIAARRLRRVLSSLEPDPVPVHIVHLEGRAAPRRVRAFIDYLAVRLRSDPALRSKAR